MSESTLPAVIETPGDPETHLIRLAIERGIDHQALQGLYDLARGMKADRAKAAFRAAMARAQEDMPVVVRDAVNKGTTSRYARLEEVQKLVMPVVTRHGFALSFGTEDCPTADYLRIVATVGHREGHSEVYRLDLPVDGRGAKGGSTAMNAVQGFGSTVSYGRRYLTLMIFNVTVSDEDNDGQTTSATISPEEATQLDAALNEANVIKTRPKFCAWVDSFSGLSEPITRLEQIPQRCMPAIWDDVNKKIAARAKNGGGQ